MQVEGFETVIVCVLERNCDFSAPLSTVLFGDLRLLYEAIK